MVLSILGIIIKMVNLCFQFRQKSIMLQVAVSVILEEQPSLTEVCKGFLKVLYFKTNYYYNDKGRDNQ